MTSNAQHWDDVYERTAETGGSWTRENVDESIDAVKEVAPVWPCRVLDVGGGDSAVGYEVARVHGRAVIVDLSAVALDRNPLHQLTDKAECFLHGDLFSVELPEVDVWHDRAVLHFLSDGAVRRAYVERAAARVRLGGGLVVATFAEDGPESCSGLRVQRSSTHDLAAEFSAAFTPRRTFTKVHVTPTGASQNFSWLLAVRH